MSLINTDRITTKAKTRYVITVGATDCQFTSIQAAIDYASFAETNICKEIYIQPGTYVENLIIPKDNADEIVDILKIYSDCMDDCIIVGNGISPTIQVFGNDFSLEQVTVTGSPTATGILVVDDIGSLDCKFNRVRCTGNLNGLEFVNSDDCKVTDCEFIGNVGYGLLLTSSDNCVIRICSAVANGNGYGVFNSSGTRIHDSAAISNFGYGFRIVESQVTSVSNLVQSNVVGMSFNKANSTTVSTGFINLNGTGIELIDTDNMLMYSTPIQLSSVIDLTIDSNSNTNTFTHNFFNLITNTGTGNRLINNHRVTPVLDEDVATVGYVKNSSGYSLSGTTTDNNWVELTEKYVLSDGQTVGFALSVIGSDDEDPDQASYWEIKGIIQNAQDTVTLLGSNPIGDVAPNVIDCYTGGTCPWRVKVEGDDVNKALKISVKGETDETIKWKANLVVNSIVNHFGGH